MAWIIPIHRPAHPAAPAALAAIVALALYAVSINGTYVYDDIVIVHSDPRLHGGQSLDLVYRVRGSSAVSSPAPAGIQWTRLVRDSYIPGAGDRLYRPVTSLSYAIQWLVNGDRPWAFHLVNVLLHALACALVAELGRRMAGGRAAPGQLAGYVAGLLFAVHPAHVEAVANIVGRAELLCAIGTLGALILFVGGPMRGWRVAAIVACFLLALLSKEQGILVPLLLLAAWPLHRRLHPPSPAQRTPTQWLTVLLCWLLAIYLIARETYPGPDRSYPLSFSWDRSILDATVNPIVASRGIDRIRVPTAILGRYVQLLIAPWRLSPDYGRNVIGSAAHWTDPYLYVGFLAIAAWLALVIHAVRSRRAAVLLCLLGLGATYGMISNYIVLIGTDMAERLLYLPSAFFLILIAMAAAILLQHPWARLRIALALALSIWIALACVRTFTYARLWNDRLNWARATLEQQPGSIRLHLLLADEWQRRGHLDQAAHAVAGAARIAPDYWFIWYRAAQIAIERGRFNQASADLDRLVELDPALPVIATLRQRIAQQRNSARPPAATQRHSATRPRRPPGPPP